MKKIVTIIIMVASINTFAQMGIGTPYDFYSLSGIQYNPGIHPEGGNSYYHNMWVTTNEDVGLSKCEIDYLKERFENDYPNHTILEDSTATYNCHGYSFSVAQGGERCNICWFDEFCRNAFIPIQTPQKGDVAVIRQYDTGYAFVLGSLHSSVVVNQDTLISKWGIGQLTKHHKDDVIGIPNMGTEYVYTYYRRVVNTQLTGPDIIDGSGTYVFTPTPNINLASCTWSVEPADMFQTSSGTGYTANLNYKTPFIYLAPKARITFTFSYSCDNHYSV